MCNKKAILDVLADMGACDLQDMRAQVHGLGHNVDQFESTLVELIRAERVRVVCGIYTVVRHG